MSRDLRTYMATPTAGCPRTRPHPSGNLVRLPDSVTFEQGARFGYLGTGFSALRKAGAGPGRTVLIDGISGTLGLGACLIALGLGVTRILGTGRNPDLLADVKAIAPDRFDVLPAGAAHLPDWVRSAPRATVSISSSTPWDPGRRPRRCSKPSTPSPAAGFWSTSAA